MERNIVEYMGDSSETNSDAFELESTADSDTCACVGLPSMHRILERYGVCILHDPLQVSAELNATTLVNIMASCAESTKAFYMARHDASATDVYSGAFRFAADHHDVEVVVVVNPNDDIWSSVHRGWPLNLKIVLVVEDVEASLEKLTSCGASQR